MYSYVFFSDRLLYSLKMSFAVSFILLSAEKKMKRLPFFRVFPIFALTCFVFVITVSLIRCPLRKHIHVTARPLRILTLRILIDFSNAIVWMASLFSSDL